MSETRQRPTDNEIRAKIAEFEASIEDDAENGKIGDDGWFEAMTAQQ